MMKYLLWIVLCLGWLMGCKEPVIENHTLLRGKEYRLWFMEANDMWCPKFLYFDQYGDFQTLEFDAQGPGTFTPYVSHPLNGHWKSLSDSLVILNGESYRIVIHPEEKWPEWSQWITLHNQSTGDTIRLLDACFPPDVPLYHPESSLFKIDNMYYERWKNEIQSSILLKGQKYKLYQEKRTDWEPFLRLHFVYYDDYGLTTSLSLFSNTDERIWLFKRPYRQLIPEILNWHQQNDTICKMAIKYIIKDISASGDTIKLFDQEKNSDFLYIDTKLPPPRI